MTVFTPTKPNRPKSSKRCTDRDLWTRLRGIRKAMALAGRAEPDEEDLADIRGVFVRWCQDWEPKTD